MRRPDADRQSGTFPLAEGAEPGGGPRPGDLLGGRYRILEVIGAGGMGCVYRARDLELEREVSLKTIATAATPDALRRFRREVKLAVRITHPNVVRLYDVGAAGAVTFLTMDLIDGCSLKERLGNEGPLSVSDACEIARQAALGLQAVHDAGVVHRDLKPANILLASDGRVVLVDFGVAGEVGHDPMASAVVGTSAYMAPEQADGEAPTPRADLYALGLVVAEMLTGEIPLLGSGLVATARRRLTEAPPSLRAARADVPAALDALVLRLLARAPGDRPGSAAEVAEALAAFTGTGPTTVAPIARRRRRRWQRRAAAALIGLGAALAATVAARRLLAPGARPPPAAVAGPRQILIGIDPTADAKLAPELDFLLPAVPMSAFRALAQELPRRVALPGVAARGALRVRASLAMSPHGRGFSASLASGRQVTTGEGATPALAFDVAAQAFIRAALPGEPRPTSADEADRVAWGAPSVAATIAVRRAQIAYARGHYGTAREILQPFRHSFLRPYLILLGNLDAPVAGLTEEARPLVAAAPAREREVFQAFVSAMAGDGGAALLSLDDPTADPWATGARAWGLASAGRLPEALALAEALVANPEIEGAALQLESDLTNEYDFAHSAEPVVRLAAHLPEEPQVWREVALIQISFDRCDEAAVSVARARALGAEEMQLAELDGQLALARFDLAAARSRASLLLTGVRAPQRVRGHEILYALDVLAGQVAQAQNSGAALCAALEENEPLIGRGEERLAGRDGVQLAVDAASRGDLALARRFAEVASRSDDSSYRAPAQELIAAFDRIEGRASRRAFEARLAAGAAAARTHNLDPEIHESGRLARLLVAASGGRCDEILAAARIDGQVATPLAAVETARCEIARGQAARARLRLERTFQGYRRLLLPSLVVQRELLLGEALYALGRPEDARPHLERGVVLASHAPGRADVARARRHLLSIPRR